MPASFFFDPERQLIVKIYSGAIRREEILDVVNCVVDDPRSHVCRNVLVDLRQASLAPLSAKDIRNLVVRVENLAERRPLKCAIVVAAELEYGLSRMYQTYSDGLHDCEIFWQWQPAVDWLREQ